MSDFVEYKPMDVEHNVKAAVENLRKAYWSNDTEKVAKIFTDAEGIIVSAICHDTYTVCKPDAERPQGELISREWVIHNVLSLVDPETRIYAKQRLGDAPTVDLKTKVSKELAKEAREIADENYKYGYEKGKADARPQGEWILNKDENPECPFCHHSFTYFGNFCSNCGADMR